MNKPQKTLVNMAISQTKLCLTDFKTKEKLFKENLFQNHHRAIKNLTFLAPLQHQAAITHYQLGAAQSPKTAPPTIQMILGPSLPHSPAGLKTHKKLFVFQVL